jgi:hypothetical protein
VLDGNATAGVRRLEGWHDSLTARVVLVRLDSVNAAPREIAMTNVGTIDVERPGATGTRRLAFAALGYLLTSVPLSAIECSGQSADCISLLGLVGGIAGGVLGWHRAEHGATHWERALVAPSVSPER